MNATGSGSSPSKHHFPPVGTIVGSIVGGVIGFPLVCLAVYLLRRHNRSKGITVEPYPNRLSYEASKASASMVEVPVNRLRPVRARSAARPATGNSSFLAGVPTSMYDASIRAISTAESESRPAEATALLQEILRRVQRLPVGEAQSEEPPPGYSAQP